MINKIVIAAAGQGTRMLHLTKNKSKHLIKVQKKPFLAYLLDIIIKAGYKELILVVGYHEEKMRKFLKDYGYKVTVVNQFKVLGEKEYGTACPLKCVKDIINKEEFLFVVGDNLYSAGDFKKMNIEDEYSYVAGIHNENPERYGVLITEDGFLKEIIEKPKEFVGNIINTGLYKFTSEVFDKLPEIKKSKRGEYEITDVINLLAKEKKVKVKEIKDYWVDFGNPGDIIKFTNFLKTSKRSK